MLQPRQQCRLYPYQGARHLTPCTSLMSMAVSARRYVPFAATACHWEAQAQQLKLGCFQWRRASTIPVSCWIGTVCSEINVWLFVCRWLTQLPLLVPCVLLCALAGRPNIRHQWNTALGCQTLHACRAVKKGEELLTSYIDLERTRAQRQQALSTRFGFDCACEACSLTGEELTASDARRAELGQLVGAVFHAVRARKFEQAVALSERQLQLLQQEGLDSPGLMERATFDAFQAARHAGQQEQALQWLRQVREHCALAMGRDAPGVKMYDEMLADEERRATTSTAVST